MTARSPTGVSQEIVRTLVVCILQYFLAYFLLLIFLLTL